MKTMVLASNNAHKLEEIKAILKDFDVELKTMKEVGLNNFEVVEDKDTLRGTR